MASRSEASSGPPRPDPAQARHGLGGKMLAIDTLGKPIFYLLHTKLHIKFTMEGYLCTRCK